MFYIETKDGDRFFTNKDSDDRLEFEKILDAKLGKDAVDMLDNLIDEAESKDEETLYRFKECIEEFDHALNRKELYREELEDILSKIQSIYFDLHI